MRPDGASGHAIPTTEAETSAVLATAFTAHWTLHGEREGALRDAVCRIAADARLGQLPIERLLVLLKRAWFEHYAQAPSEPSAHRDRLSTLVSSCIDAYYRPHR